MKYISYNIRNGLKIGFLFTCFLVLASVVSAATINVTFQVDVSREQNVSSVFVAGDFQSWAPAANPMTSVGGGLYSVTIPLPSGSTISYRFIKNGYLWEQPTGGCASILTRSTVLPSSDIILSVECFNNCGTCPAIPARNVTFQVDMSTQTVSPNGVHVTGDFQGWNPATTALTNMGNGIYAVTLPFYTGSLPVNYKYLNGNAWGTNESVIGSCETSSNRYFNPPALDSTLGTVCFASCVSCASTVNVNVTFQVDMSHVAVSLNGVNITGDFQGWNPATTALTNTGGGIYSVTLSMPAGTAIQYKFLNGNAWGNEEMVFGSCAYRTNRLYTFPTSDATVGSVCFGYCNAACTPVSGTKVACIGNSITFGANLTNPAIQGYPAQLNKLLGNTYAVENFGHSGATMLRNGDTPYWSQIEFTNAQFYNPDIVVMKLGTNDSKSWNWVYGSQYVTDYDSMINVFRALPSKPKIFVCIQSEAFSTAYGIDETVLAGQIRPDVKKVAKDRGVSIIDIYDATKNYSANFPDGIHPDSIGDSKIAERVNQMLTYSLASITRAGDSLTAPLGNAYQWYLNGDTIAGSSFGTSRKIKATQLGDYMVGVKLLSTNEDRAISSIFTVSTLTEVLSSNDISSSIGLFPNPTDDRALLTLNNSFSGIIEINVMDVLGKTVKAFSIVKQSTYTEQELNLNGMQKGIYIVEVAQGDSKGFKRIVKQ